MPVATGMRPLRLAGLLVVAQPEANSTLDIPSAPSRWRKHAGSGLAADGRVHKSIHCTIQPLLSAPAFRLPWLPHAHARTPALRYTWGRIRHPGMPRLGVASSRASLQATNSGWLGRPREWARNGRWNPASRIRNATCWGSWPRCCGHGRSSLARCYSLYHHRPSRHIPM